MLLRQTGISDKYQGFGGQVLGYEWPQTLALG